MTPRHVYPPPLTPTQLGPTAKPGICAYAPERGCGMSPARFYARGWRCEKCADLTADAPNPFKPKTGIGR